MTTATIRRAYRASLILDLITCTLLTLVILLLTLVILVLSLAFFLVLIITSVSGVIINVVTILINWLDFTCFSSIYIFFILL